MSTRARILAIVGPTGTGKSELAAVLARRIGAEIISADSVQVYRRMDIGTAKPSLALRAEIPHHGIDVVDPDESMSAGRFAELARAAAESILARGRPAILCGGSGLYVRAFACGLIAGVESDGALRAELETLSDAALLEALRGADPELAARIHPNNRLRLMRALEIARLGGREASRLHSAHRFADRPFDVVWLGLELPRALLWERLRARVAAMFAAGWVDEVRALHAAGFGPELRALRSIGYREIGELLAGRLDEPTARERIWLATRRFAKRQRTWFRAEPGLQWVDARDPERCLDLALTFVRAGGAS